MIHILAGLQQLWICRFEDQGGQKGISTCWIECYLPHSLRRVRISGRPSLFPYSIVNQPIKEMYATRKQVRLKRTADTDCVSILLAEIRGNWDFKSCMSLMKVIEIIAVEKPLTTPTMVSHLQNMAGSWLRNQDCKIFVDLTNKTPEIYIYITK